MKKVRISMLSIFGHGLILATVPACQGPATDEGQRVTRASGALIQDGQHKTGAASFFWLAPTVRSRRTPVACEPAQGGGGAGGGARDAGEDLVGDGVPDAGDAGNTGSGGSVADDSGAGGAGGDSGSGDGPCTGLCDSPIIFMATPTYLSGALLLDATCHETTANIQGGACGNFVSPRTFTINGIVMEDCVNGALWPFLPARRNGGYCFQASPGEFSYAYFVTF